MAPAIPARIATVPTRSPTQAATTATPTDNNSIGHTSGFGPIITSGGSLVFPWEMLDADLPPLAALALQSMLQLH